MGSLRHVAWQAKFEAKGSDESRNGIRSCWGVVAGGRRVRSGRSPPGDTLTANTALTLYEEEISDVSLSTFYAFDHESAGARRPGLQLTQRTRRGRPGQDRGGCAGDCGGGGPTCCATCATMPGCGADLGERGRAVAFLAAALTGSIRPLDRTPALPQHPFGTPRRQVKATQ
jgi:hypothetical protein